MKRKKEFRVISVSNLYIILFCMVVIFTQYIRSNLNSIINMFNYHIESIVLCLIIIVISKKINIKNVLAVIIITFFTLLSFFVNDYSKIILFRSIATFICPLIFLFLDNESNFERTFSVCTKYFNCLIYISFVYTLIQFFTDSFETVKRTGGLVGHPLTAAWYYVIFISMNMICCKYINKKNNYKIILQILIANLGCIFAAGRIGIFACLILSLLYIVTCSTNKTIKYLIIPIAMIILINSEIFDQMIWSKFEYAIGYGDITNGRLLGIREMEFFNIYPQFISGKGISYSNYLTLYLFGTLNFENPILMFAFDYGILCVIIMCYITIAKPIIMFIKNKQWFIFINFMIVVIIPYTYNGIAESTGLYFVLILIIVFYILLSKDLTIKNKEEEK